MFPWIYEFHWTPMHIAFLGIFFAVATVVALTFVTALRRTGRVFTEKAQEKLQWMSEFEDLPTAARVCRHQMNGEIAQRTCHSEFDCRECTAHPRFTGCYAPQLEAASAGESLYGLSMPLDRYYHRGHTWVKPEANGDLTIGLDDLGRRMLGSPDAVELPAVGSEIIAQGTGWTMKKGKASLRVLAPIDGVVVEQGSPASGWYLRVRPKDGTANVTHLLRGSEVKPWTLREIERLEIALSSDGLGMSLADGGELIEDMSKHAPEVDWDGVWGTMLLQA